MAPILQSIFAGCRKNGSASARLPASFVVHESSSCQSALGWKINNAFDRHWAGVANVLSKRMFCVAWSPDGSKLAIGFKSEMVAVADISKEHVELEVLVEKTNRGLVGSIKWSPDSSRLAYVDLRQKKCGIISVSNNSDTLEIQGFPVSVDWCPDGTKLAVGFVKGNVSILDAKSGAVISKFGQKGWREVHVSWAYDCDLLAIAYTKGLRSEGLLEVVNTRSEQLEMNTSLQNSGGSVRWAPRAQAQAHGMLAVGGATEEDSSELFWCVQIHIIDFASKADIGKLDGRGDVKDLQWSLDGSKILALGFEPADGCILGFHNTCVSIVDVASCKILHVIKVAGEPSGMSLSPDGTMLARVAPLRIVDVDSLANGIEVTGGALSDSEFEVGSQSDSLSDSEMKCLCSL